MIDDKRIPGGVVHELPGDLRDALNGDAAALATWHDITPLARNEWICWIGSAKKAETREKRIRWAARTSAKVSAASAAGEGARIGEVEARERSFRPVADISSGVTLGIGQPGGAKVFVVAPRLLAGVSVASLARNRRSPHGHRQNAAGIICPFG